MQLLKHCIGMTVYPNAKINFGLKVLRRRSDGYHDLETVFLPVKGLYDTLIVEKAQQGEVSSFTQAGIRVDCSEEDNLVMRVLRLMQREYSGVGEVKVCFTKNIPYGAGLGGGSADAAFMAKAINGLFELGLTTDELEQLIAPLGADCPFFVRNTPRLAMGTGNVFSEVPRILYDKLNGMWLLLAKPDVAVSTAAAYKGIVPKDTHFVWDGTLTSFTNDFESTVFPLFPKIAEVKQRLIDAGAVHAAMSGSGATVFGIFNSRLDMPENFFPDCFVHQEQLSF